MPSNWDLISNLFHPPQRLFIEISTILLLLFGVVCFNEIQPEINYTENAFERKIWTFFLFKLNGRYMGFSQVNFRLEMSCTVSINNYLLTVGWFLANGSFSLCFNISIFLILYLEIKENKRVSNQSFLFLFVYHLFISFYYIIVKFSVFVCFYPLKKRTVPCSFFCRQKLFQENSYALKIQIENMVLIW